MKVLTLHQPWASLVALGVKTIETRSWSTQYRGPLAIHAAATMPSYDKRYVSGVGLRHEAGYVGGEWRIHLFNEAGKRHAHAPEPKLRPEYGEVDWHCPLGAIVATCTLVDVVPIVRATSPFTPESPSDAVVMAWKGDWIYRKRNGVAEPSDQRPYGDFTPGRFAWLLTDVVPVDPPVPFKGGQGLTKTWTPEPQDVAS